MGYTRKVHTKPIEEDAPKAASRPSNWVPEDTFATRLRAMRHDLSMTAEALATLCGQRTSTWTTWEKGANPRNMAKVVEAIHDATGVSREWLMWGHNRSGSSGCFPNNPDVESVGRNAAYIEAEAFPTSAVERFAIQIDDLHTYVGAFVEGCVVADRFASASV